MSGGRNDRAIYDHDPAQALDGPEAIAVFIADALDTEDAA
jgi:DNA-binding phage protein